MPIPPSGGRDESQIPQRDPYLSLWQSAAKEVGLETTTMSADPAETANRASLLMSPVLIATQLSSAGSGSDEALGASIGEWVDDCAKTVGKFLWAEMRGDKAAAERFAEELKKSECDPHWEECLRKYLEYKATGGKFPYRKDEDHVVEVTDPVRIALAARGATPGC